jgi:hypothetical protein
VFDWAAVLVGIMILVNRQEAVFACTVIVGISVMRLLRTYNSSSGAIHPKVVQRSRVVGYSILTLVALGVIFGYDLRQFIIGSEVTTSRFTEPGLIDFGPYLRIDWQVLIANPTMRFWDTLAPTGVVVYLWYIARLKWFRGADYLNVGMLSPLLTLFNPLFVWWFLHLASWDPLW